MGSRIVAHAAIPHLAPARTLPRQQRRRPTLAASGYLNPLIAGAAMAFSSVFVVSDSLRQTVKDRKARLATSCPDQRWRVADRPLSAPGIASAQRLSANSYKGGPISLDRDRCPTPEITWSVGGRQSGALDAARASRSKASRVRSNRVRASSGCC